MRLLMSVLLLSASCEEQAGGTSAATRGASSPARGPDYAAFGPELPVQIKGHAEDAMEPFISKDGRTLFFNGSNAPNVDTDLYFADRRSDDGFTSRGRIAGANSPSLDAVASMDAAGNFYFVSVRDYDATRSSIYRGRFARGELSQPVRVGGVSRRTAWVVNFDAEISGDGGMLIIADGLFSGGHTPDTARLVLLDNNGSGFDRRADSDLMLANINNIGLNYAPSISADGLELFFTRIPDIAAPRPAIYRSTRTDMKGVFAAPQRVAAITGYAEAPSLSADGRTLYYHKQVDGVFRIFRVVRP